MKKIVLVYHQIDENDPFMSVSLDIFKKQMNYLIKKRFTFCNIEELLSKKHGNHVCVMFDDGYKSIIPALNYLNSRNLQFSLSIIKNKVNKKSYLSKQDLDGTIYFHTNNHLDLTKLPNSQLEQELKCDYDYYSNCVVYPMGRYDKRVINSVSKKFKYGLSLLPFHITKRVNNYEIPRICVNGYLNFSKFKLFVSKFGNLYLHLAFMKRKLLKQDYLSE